uniref:Uncharacterized protein n=1 Tax=Mycena chlorophos TaxID=658473 RepID=A0ABQ0LBP6_MYCCL|nr:predicted protein [Mycena chlorophos]
MEVDERYGAAEGGLGTKRRRESDADVVETKKPALSPRSHEPDIFDILFPELAASGYSESDADSEATLERDDELFTSYTDSLPGNSLAAQWARKQNALRAALFEKDPSIKTPQQREKLAIMLKRVHKEDPAGEVLSPKEHVQRNCNTFTAASNTRSLFFHFAPNPNRSSAGPLASTSSSGLVRDTGKQPCLGLSADQFKRIAQYLERSGAGGDGGPAVSTLAMQTYGTAFALLKPRRKRDVQRMQQLAWRWTNDHQFEAVYSVHCTEFVASGDIGPCLSCFGLLRLRNFRKAINRPLPADENFKYNNKQYLHQSTAKIFARSKGLIALFEGKITPGLQYAVNVASRSPVGEQGTQEQFFADLLTVMTSKERKATKGKGMQGFQWKMSPLLYVGLGTVHVAVRVYGPVTTVRDPYRTRSSALAIRPDAYRALERYLPLPDERTLQRRRAKLPKFPVEFTRRTITLAKDRMTAMGWSGPVAMSCDDTKLQAALRPFYDENRQSWCILGSTGAPMLIANLPEFRQAVELGTVERATKLRLWCLQVCCPGVPSYILAAKGISDSLVVAELFEFSWKLPTELIDEGILVCSYASDGTTTERNVQHMIADRARPNSRTASTTRVLATISLVPDRSGFRRSCTLSAHPTTKPRDARMPPERANDISITIPVINGQPIALIQDDLHLKKTLRNNPFSGAKSLTFPQHTVHFAQVLRIAEQGAHDDVVSLLALLGVNVEELNVSPDTEHAIPSLARWAPSYDGDASYSSPLVEEYETQDLIDEQISAAAAAIGDLGDVLANALPPVNISAPPTLGTLPVLSTADLSALVEIRRAHGTRMSAHASRTKGRAQPAGATDPTPSAEQPSLDVSIRAAEV